jgi:hypothetical protein
MKKISLVIFAVFVMTGMVAGQNLEVIEKSFRIENEPFKVDIDMEAGDFEIRKSDEPGIVKMRVQYPSGRATVDYNGHGDELSLNIQYKNVWGDNSQIKTFIYIPEDKIIDLKTWLKFGKLDFELGGLQLRNVEIGTNSGEAVIRFSEPNKIAMQLLSVNCSVGEARLEKLGNARIQRATINSGIGELSADFSGSYKNDAKVRLDLDIGETLITLPDNLGVRMKVNRSSILSSVKLSEDFEKQNENYYSRGYSNFEHNLNMIISTGIGELSIR